MRGMLLVAGALAVAGGALAEQGIMPEKPNAVEFIAAPARFVRMVVQATSNGNGACIDELEVYTPNGTANLARLPGAKASASSCIEGYSIHEIEHLNDGEYGNDHSWVAAGSDSEWAQIELPQETQVGRVVFSRDRNGTLRDRVPVKFDVCVSLDGAAWKTVKSVSAGVAGETALNIIPSSVDPPEPREFDLVTDPVRSAFLGEEHAWLRTFGRADLSPALVPYNGRVKEYPRHVEDDVLPLPELSRAPRMNKPRWLDEASRGVVRVADPLNWEQGPLAEIEVWAATCGGNVYVCLGMDRLLSKFLAVLSTGDGGHAGVVMLEEKKLKFVTYAKQKEGFVRVAESVEPDQFVSGDRDVFAFRLPLEMFGAYEQTGLRVGLGMGGKHVPSNGRGILLHKSNLALREVAGEGGFAVGLRASSDAVIRTNGARAGAAQNESVTLRAGEERVIEIEPEKGPIGPEFNLQIKDEQGTEYALHLFRYDPAGRTLDLMDEMIARLDGAGVDVENAKTRVAELREKCRRDARTTKRSKRARELF
ncbi:MAG: discoidin domain-containing protein [Candidatus Hydrogenedentes bacterium]|nr:discoidin domain-containing protein [Candidatus Hydrogenedentota bacterium]